VKFDALVLTQNEELQIAECLHSLAPAGRILVLDSGSTDQTLEIARRVARVEILTRAFKDFADQRNFGLAQFAPDTWVLHLDADERLTPELAAALAALQPPADAVAYNLASRTFWGGRAVLRASGFPVYQTRLSRAGRFRFEQVGHGQKAPTELGTLPRLSAAYDHHPFEKGFEHWRARHERYADDEVRELRAGGSRPTLLHALADPIARRQWLKHATARLALRPAWVWLHLMFIRRGLLDGRAGWEYCRRRWLYEQMVSSRLHGTGRPMKSARR
jgi:glycosyltransferase involved in cell wall biosynthesis